MLDHPQSPEEAVISAKRALLRQQIQLLGEELAWLADPGLIPAAALNSAAECGDLSDQCFSLAAWVVGEIALAASRLHQKLCWEDTFECYRVPSESKPRIVRALLEPVTRYAPGILALSEIVAAIPVVAIRESVPLGDWGRIARRSEEFGVKLSCDGTEVQVLIRNYLRKPPQPSTSPDKRVLDSTRLKLDDEIGVTSVTPIDDLVSVARAAVTEHIGPAKGICVAMQAKAPVWGHTSEAPATMYDAVWSAYTAAAEHLIFPNVDISGAEIPAQAGPDPHFALAINHLARDRGAELRSR
jgi:hypothetical protein